MYHRTMMRAWATLARLSLAVVVTASAGAQSDTTTAGCDGLLGVRSTLGYLHIWSETIELRGMEDACRASDVAPFYWQMRAAAENLLGNHAAALVDFDRQYRGRAGPRKTGELPPGTRSVPALSYIEERARDHRFVMVNERHHVSTERLLTLALLRPLYEQGFRYLAAEALSSRGTEVAVRGYPVGKDGTSYINDAVLVDGEGARLRVEPDRVDIRILNPRTEYVNDRPAWLEMGGRRRAVAIATPECVEEACVVEAFDAAWEEGAVPYDRVEVVEDSVDMYLPPGVEVELRAYRLDGSPVFRRTETTTRPTPPTRSGR